MKKFLGILILGLLTYNISFADDLKIIDGDTIVLNGEKIDFLFIDGDHRYDGVKSDFEMYKSLVKSGGLIGFHDIVDTEYHHKLDCYVDKLWNEIKSDYEYVEFIQDPNQRKYGIGVLTMH